MKKFFLYIVIFIAVIFAATQFVALPKAQKNIVEYLTAAGFKSVTLNNAKISLNGLTIGNAVLDKDGFNKAKNITVSLLWPEYLFTANIKSIDIEALQISSVTNTPNDFLKYKNYIKINKLSDFPIETLNIEEITWDIATKNTALRINGDLHLNTQDDIKKIDANLNARQHDLSFNSQWSGTINSDKKMNIEGLYDSLNIKTNFLNVNRGTGWVSFEQKDETPKISAQMDAGSGHLLKVPVKNISLLLDQNGDSYPVILRAQSSSLENHNLYGDFSFSKTPEKQAFEILLKLDNPNKFVSTLRQQNILNDKTNNKVIPNTKTDIYLTYVPENRFIDGPLPFNLTTKNNEDRTVSNGTFLIYPNSLDLRGTIQGEPQIISLIETLFTIDPDNVSDGNLRLDENIKSLLK